ncbi:GreA/GreB family elongation factor [Olivibacter sitiensis]|uniref:GreA/GreB family elongation factor n=1 Tax=Olivibacter sitiensis TaxID=376470 RepID=UPI000488894F|nr:GreA/GreB family elongation factor [Olivibacter sitiensis]
MSANFITINKKETSEYASSKKQFAEPTGKRRIEVASKMKLRELVGPNIISFQINDATSDNYELKTISSRSVLARAVLGAHEGDIVGLHTKVGYRKFLVIEVA